MSENLRRFIRADDLTPEKGWLLIEWCAERGGDEFSVQFMCLDGVQPTSQGELTKALTTFRRGTPKREHVTTMAGEQSRRPTETWRLCTESIAALRCHISDGLFTAAPYTATGWLEDFTIYRRGEIVLGVISHEGTVALRLIEQEHREFSDLEIKSYESAF